MTLKDLKKRLSLETTQQHSKLSERLLNKPFWIWDQHQHKLEDVKTNGDCCFNHIIGLPQKDGIDKPLYDYEKIIFDSLVRPSFMNRQIKQKTELPKTNKLEWRIQGH
ncbi:MAG: hypothetical protein ACJ71K_00060 [Nitrososphaeraceae archaeon]